MADHVRRNPFGFSKDPAEQVTPPRPIRKAAIQNVRLKVAAATTLAREVAEQARQGNVRLEDFSFEEELERAPARKKR